VAVQVEVEAEYAPELFTLQPQLADLVGMLHGTRQSILHALWHYIHLNKLQVLSQRQSRCMLLLSHHCCAAYAESGGVMQQQYRMHWHEEQCTSCTLLLMCC